ncbi:MAG: ATP-binding protein [Polyangiales bacterium]
MAGKARFLAPYDGHFFLFGPRGTGKSTWLERYRDGALHIDLLQPEQLRQYAGRPERLRALLEAQPDKAVVVIDEVQKVPALLDVVHGLIEAGAPQRFVLTGSSARKLKASGVNLLAGRAALRALHPYMAAEMGADFDLGRALRQGMLPLVVEAKAPEEVLRAYGGLYLKEEVQQEGIVRNLGDFARFVEAASFSHGALWNATTVARSCQVSRRTVDGYAQVLEDLLLSFHLTAFRRRAQRALVAHHKFYYFDCGIYRSLRPTGPLDLPEETAGTALEGLVAQHLRAWCDYRLEARHSLHFWRTQSGTEVDFVVYGPDSFCAIEVKHARQVQRKDLRDLKAFGADYPEANLRLLYGGSERLMLEGVLCLPVEAYLRAVHPAEALP